MKSTILKCGFIFLMLFVSAGGLMYISHRVQTLQKEMAFYDREIEKEEEKNRVLKAEWAHLNDPARLEVLASKAYGLHRPDIGSNKSGFDFIPGEEINSSSYRYSINEKGER